MIFFIDNIEGLVQDDSNLILQERVKIDSYSQFRCQYSAIFDSIVIENYSIIIESKMQNTYTNIKIDYKSQFLPSPE